MNDFVEKKKILEWRGRIERDKMADVNIFFSKSIYQNTKYAWYTTFTVTKHTYPYT